PIAPRSESWQHAARTTGGAVVHLGGRPPLPLQAESLAATALVIAAAERALVRRLDGRLERFALFLHLSRRCFDRLVNRLLDRQRNLLRLAVDVQHLDVDFLAFLDERRDVADPMPGDLADVYQPFDAGGQ